MSLKPNSLIASALLLTAGTPRAAPAQEPPPGWTAQTTGGQTVLTPPDLKPGEFYKVILFPPYPLRGASLTGFVDALTAKEVSLLGKPVGAPKPATALSHGIAAAATRAFVSKRGQILIATDTAFSFDRKTVRVMAVLQSQDESLPQRYQAQVSKIMGDVLSQGVADAKASGDGARIASLLQAPNSMKPGGKVVPGIYEGDAVFTGEGEPIPSAHFRLYLYATGEMRLYRANGDQVEAGSDDYAYDPASGKMEVGNRYAMNNLPDPVDGLCLYGRGAEGKPYLYARRRYSDGHTRTTTLRYIGPPDRLSSKQSEAAKEAAEAEARRYKFVTAPGKGLKPSQIEGIFYQFRVPIYGVPSPSFEVYLLLKDGTVHDDLPVAPDELDVALSRQGEPKHWGHWRRQGKDVLMEWPGHPGRFEAVAGSLVVPGRPAERLSGRYGGASSGGSFATGGYYSFYGVTFTPDGRFSKDQRGGTSSSGLGSSLNDFSVSTTYDNEQSSTTFSAPSAVGGVATKRKKSGRAGTYSVNGYTMTLRYDDGRVERLPFFFLSKERYFIYFEGSMLKSASYNP